MPGARHLLGCAVVALAATACGGGGPGDGGPAALAREQTVAFSPAPTLMEGGMAIVKATASSGLPVRYGSATPTVCRAVDASAGLITGVAAGVCVVEASQHGNAIWAGASAQQRLNVTVNQDATITFGASPQAAVYDVVLVQAVAKSGKPVAYQSLTPAICSVDSASGRVAALAAGDCAIGATLLPRPGVAAQPPVVQTFSVAPAQATPAAPDAPQNLDLQIDAPKADGTAATAAAPGASLATVWVYSGVVRAHGSPITGYTVTSSPAGVSARSATLPVAVTCPGGSCAGYSFMLSATNAKGTSVPSAPADLVVKYKVHQVYDEPDYKHIDTEFRGSFSFNASKRTVSALQGDLSEVMAGNDKPGQAWPMGMPLLALKHQLGTQKAPGGLLVTTFLHNSVLTLTDDLRDDRSTGDGWSPGPWKYHGYANGNRTSPNPGNAYAMVYINTTDPTTPLTPAQIDKLAYADCADQGMMGDDCMTGTTVAGYGTIGSMRGYPVSQVITRQ